MLLSGKVRSKFFCWSQGSALGYTRANKSTNSLLRFSSSFANTMVSFCPGVSFRGPQKKTMLQHVLRLTQVASSSQVPIQGKKYIIFSELMSRDSLSTHLFRYKKLPNVLL